MLLGAIRTLRDNGGLATPACNALLAVAGRWRVSETPQRGVSTGEEFLFGEQKDRILSRNSYDADGEDDSLLT